MRLDKFLKVSRLIKRRTVANEACDAGRVLVNDKPAKASASVKAGDKIGRVGATGNAMCAHLHFEVRINGKAYNPRKFY